MQQLSSGLSSKSLSFARFPCRFVFLWTRGYDRANETGAIYSYWPIQHSWGMMASWMSTPNLGQNAWSEESQDHGGRCFIGFDPYSAWFTMNATSPNRTFGDFASKFYEYLSDGYILRIALEEAVDYAFGSQYDFETSQLNQGYWIHDPANPGNDILAYMRVWGDGGITLPS